MVQLMRERATLVALSLSLGLGIAWALIQPPVVDLAAQTFRADLWSESGWTIWNPAWYGGHELPGYSLLFPPLASALGLAAVGVASAVGATLAFGLICRDALGERAWLGVIWFGAASTVALWGGRLTFALGLTFGLGCLLALQRDRPAIAGLLGLGAALASPVAGLFTLLAAAACALARLAPPGSSGGVVPLTASTAAAAGAAAGIIVPALAFPTDGTQPFVFGAFIWVPLAAVAVAVAAGHRRPELRWGAVLYLALGVLAFVIDTPLGGNTTRLGSTFAGPVLALLLLPRRPLLLAAVCLPLLFWQWTATVRDVAAAEGDPSTEASYYAPLLERLEAETSGRPIRVRVPPTRNRWEAVHVAERFGLDGGWLRQLEAPDFDFLEADSIDGDDYLAWVRARGDTFVAVNDAEPDRLAAAERELLDGGGFTLEPIWSDEHWRLYRVAPPRRALADGARLLELGPDRFALRMTAPEAILRIRYSTYFEVVEGAGCVGAVAGDERLTRIVADPGSRVTVEARLSGRGVLDAVLGRRPECR